jgi:hypothetical protein
MAIQFRWIIQDTKIIPVEGNFDNVVCQLTWMREGGDLVDGKKYSASMSGKFTLPPPSTPTFTPFDQLTYEEVCGWLDNILDVEFIDGRITTMINNQLNPYTPVSTNLPFKQPDMPLISETTTTTTTTAFITTTTTTTIN